MEKELQRLRENHCKIQALLSASNEAHIADQNSALNSWMWQLRDAIDEADDLLDEFEYLKLKERATEQNMEETKKRSAATSFLFERARKLRKLGGRALKIDCNLKRLVEAVQKLDKVSAEVSAFFPILIETKQVQQAKEQQLCDDRASGSYPGFVFIGRGKEKEFVMRWLKEPSIEDLTGTSSNKNISLLSIVGHGGMGKTTLLHHVFQDVKDEFDLKMWFCVSNTLDFDAKKVIADMLEHVKKTRPRLESLAVLQENLKSEVQCKKFLLVLDDIWEDEEERDKRKWENVLSPLAYGKLGSKILVTTRMDSAASMIAKVIRMKKETFRLGGLEEDECLQLLNTHAFADENNGDDHQQLRCIARNMVKKLLGSPLIAKVIGAVLNSSLNVEHWKRILKSDIGSAEPEEVHNNIMPILRLSYKYLEKHLQICFVFCGLFPQDHCFDKNDLVRMWIALGFIQPSFNSGEIMEDVGRRYIDILVKKSFFENTRTFDNNSCKMHDLLHELAQSVSAQEYFHFVENIKLPFHIPKTTRHLSIQTTNLQIMRKIRELKNLRSMFFWFDREDQDFIDVLTEIFKESTSIRLVFIRSPSLRVIPEAIENLMHLRYLNISRSYVTQLPRSLSSLYHLQFIIYQIYSVIPSNDLLPRDINKLSNLRYMEMPRNVFSWIHGFGKLNSLQKLDAFYVKNEDGYRIGELEHMNDLRLLNIKFLGSVKDAKEACSAKLCEKRNLLELSLDWGDTELVSQTPSNIVDCSFHEQVFANLQPQNNLKKLCIHAYMGARSATWMDNANLISNLNFIHLDKCLEWETLPPFGQLPFLKCLFLWNMPKAKRLNHQFQGKAKHCVFPSLQLLHIRKLDALEDLFDTAGAAEDDGFFPCFTQLYLIDCPNLHQFPFFPPKLKTLTINNIGWKALNRRCPCLASLPLADEIVRLEALRNLTIQNCPALISLSLNGLQEAKFIENLRLILGNLSITDPSLLLMEPLRSITSLERLTIEDNDEVVAFPFEVEQWFLQVSSSLCKLFLRRLKSLKSLPSSLKSLSSLKTLHVYMAPLLELLLNIPTSLEYLVLQELESLQCLPYSLSAISSLKQLRLVGIPLLKSLPDLPDSLLELYLHDLAQLDCQPSSLATLSSLQKLYIIKVPKLRELPNLPHSLVYLTIHDCQQELMERYEELSGSDWHKIALIPYVYIS
ncbi:LOW QUALITY PROTEIN: putative disease resistance protein RGA4 [Phalaenopsis equestris]|uniref:LOW QUALITY PROTEIN: putative disease resistance protein RGA4 n=1 Tax=Phalaenopsis equestris TaxID=78828 RepID=UPI0009E4A019|nr:LOW QUALITY PROTEIN: putative disease resistance protein RGA4 [Phalaenopsis equestris]